MSGDVAGGLAEHFGELEDPRCDQGKRHQLLDIIAIAICALICGADGWQGVEEFGKAKETWLRGFLALPHGIPSHDTFGRVFARLDPVAFQESYRAWIEAMLAQGAGAHVAVDGKTLRGSQDTQAGQRALQMVSAWATETHVVLGQVKVERQANEIRAIPELLRLLDLAGCTVTLDAQGCQTEIAEGIREQGGHYVLALKQNQGSLYEAVRMAFEEDVSPPPQGDTHQTQEKGDAWTDLRSVARVETERQVGSQVSGETRYFISSLPGEAPALAELVRAHWQIENSLHWVLDVALREDDLRIRKGHGPENMAVLRHMAIVLLKGERTATVGVKNKRLRAALDHDYLLRVLSA